MARKRKAKQKVMDPVTQEIYDLLHGNNSDVAVDVVTAEYKVLVEVLNDAVPEAILDVTKLPPILDTSKLPPLDVVEVECPPVEVKETVVVKVEEVKQQQIYTDPSLKKLFDLIEEFCK